MSVDKLGAVGFPLTGGNRQSISIQAQADLSATLTRGDILKGKVLRQYDGTRYGVEFGGKEVVVDSSIPLKPGEFLQGRVIAIDDKVHLQRIFDSGRQQEGGGKSESAAGSSFTATDLEAALLRFQQGLTQEQISMLNQISASGKPNDRVVSAALLVSKLGLPLDPELVKAVHVVMTQSSERSSPLTSLPNVEPLENPNMRAPSAETVAVLAGILQASVDATERQRFEAQEVEEHAPQYSEGSNTGRSLGDSDGERRDGTDWNLGYWLLNAQDESSVGHKYIVLPVWIGDRLMEVEVAFFSPRGGKSDGDENGVRTSRISLSLETDTFGRFEIDLLVAERHLRLSAVAESEQAAVELSRQLPLLKDSLKVYGWSVDDASYSVRPDTRDGVLRHVVQHYATQDSLSQLM